MGFLVNYNGPKTQNDLQMMTQTGQRSAQYDPVEKLRMSTPQSLIDTDFEYGPQPTKWESISLQQGRPSTYILPQLPRVITTVTTNATTLVVLNMANTAGFSVGTPIYVQGALDPLCNGWFSVSALVASTSVSYVLPVATTTSGNQFNGAATYVYLGYFYSGSGMQLTSTSAFTFSASSTITCTTTNPHGLSKGSYIYITGTTGPTDPTSINAAQVVATVPTANTFTFTNVNGTPSTTIANTAGITNLFARAAGFVEPRTFDGGVAFSAGAAVPGQQLIRQTRRYFRYQSGKGLQFSTGSSLKPVLFTTSLTASSTAVGATVTVTTRYPHSLATGTTVIVAGVDQTGYNGTYVITVPSGSAGITTFTYIATTAPSATTATGVSIKVNPSIWYGSSNRVGMFDQQNGMFFEYDGTTLYAVWRNSVTQLNGTVTATNGSNAITGVGTQFTTQLSPNDYIVIRGQSYKVITIASDTSLYISPEYRGTTLANCIVSKTIDTRVPQSAWFDPCDGTGQSGYTLDLTKMQMWYIDYSWYGAGVIRWGFRTQGGAVVYVYAQQNNNQRYEAYMRSGNMGAHYESNGQQPSTILTATLSSTEVTAMNVGSTTGFPTAGTVRISQPTQTGAVEYIAYTGKTATTLTGLTRIQIGGTGVAQTFTAASPSTNAIPPIAVELAVPDSAAALSHWGSSVIMDGRFDDDKSLLFNSGMTSALTTTTSGQSTVLMAIRLAPAADNGQPGLLGAKEIINRAQLQMTELGLYTTGTGYFIQLYLNGFPSAAFGGGAAAFASPTAPTSSLAQVAFNTTLGTTITAGESVAAAYTNTTGQTTLDLSQVRDLGNSILGGGTTGAVPTSQSGFYPDGPDILYVVATALSATSSTIVARLTWKEAQA